jgi:hypothetical protein
MRDSKFLREMIPDALSEGNGSLSALQRRMKIELLEDPTILEDPIAAYIIGKCAEHTWYKHTAAWRRLLAREYNFSFEETHNEEVCRGCNGTGVASYDPSSKCWSCSGTGNINVKKMKAWYNGNEIEELLR